MKRFWMLIPLLFLTLSLFPSEQVGAQPVHFSPNFTALDLITEVNNLRAVEKLPFYTINPTLMSIAQAHADYIAGSGVMTHFDVNGNPPFQRAIMAGYSVAGDLSQGGLFFENLASTTSLTASGVVDIWQADPEDLQTMISADLEDIGAGFAVAGGVTYYVLNAGTKTNESSATSTPSGTQPVGMAVNTPMADGTVYHLVQADEGLWGIARNYNTTIEELKLLNGLSTDEIFEGQKLLVRKPEVKTVTPTVAATATFGIPTSTATHPITPTLTSTATPLPVSPTSPQSGGMIVGVIILGALIAAGVGSWLGSKKSA